MSDTNTARERLLGYCLAATSNEVTCRKAEELADAYRDEVLAEAAELIRQHRGDLNTPTPWGDTRDRDTAARLLFNARTHRSDDWVVCSPEWLAAGGDCHGTPRRPAADPRYSHEHLAARTTTAPTTQEQL